MTEVDEGVTLPETVAGAAIVVDDEERLVDANDSCAVVFESNVEEILGVDLETLVDENYLGTDFLSRFRDARRSLAESEADDASFTTTIRSGGEGEGHTYEVEVLPGDATAETVVCSLRDVGTQFRYEDTVDALNHATRELMAADSKTEVFGMVGEYANDVLEFPGTGVRMYDPEEEVLRHVAFGGVVNEIDSRPPYPVDDSPHGRAFESGETVIDEIGTDDPFDRDAFSHTMYVPIGGYGILSLGKVGGPFDRADVHFAEILAENARAALRQVEQKERLREQRQKLETQNERLDEFASVVSHDLRNPLSVARGAREALADTDDEKYLDDIDYALDRMDEIIEEVLTLAREGRTVDETEPVSLGAAVRQAWGNVATGDVDLVVETDATVEGDQRRLLRLFENLFRNSVEHGDGEDADLSTVRVGRTDGGFYVEDDGVGIPPDVRDAVFETEFTTAQEGTGFGLAIVDRVADAHGFDVTITEGADGGARFAFTGVRFVEGANGGPSAE